MSDTDFNRELVAIIPKLRIIAIKFYKDEDDRNDLVQETLLKVLRYKDHYKKIENISFISYCSTIMKNTFINRVRRSKTNPVDLKTDISKPDRNPDAVDQIALKELNQAIDNLNPDFRDILKMNIQGYQYKELTEMFDLPMGTIKSRIFFAKKKLKENLSI